MKIPQTRQEAQTNMEQLIAGNLPLPAVTAYLKSRPIGATFSEELLGYRDAVWSHKKAAKFGTADLDLVKTEESTPFYNTFTTCAFILASLGIRVVKHGNWGLKHSTGTFDFLESIGFSLQQLTEKAETALEEFGLAFTSTQAWYPALESLNAARRGLDRPTVFDLLGPLLNPANPRYRIVACPAKVSGYKLALALHNLQNYGCVVSGEDGLSGVTLSEKTTVQQITRFEILESTISPSSFGFSEEFKATRASAEQNVTQFYQLIEGEDTPIKNLVILNAAFALHKLEGHDPLLAVEIIKHALNTGKVKRFFQSYLKYIN